MTERYPAGGLLYHPDHGWARLERHEAELGITWFAQDSLGEITYVRLPALGTSMTAGVPYAEIESLKAVSDVVAPLSGEVVGVNEELVARPDMINEEPYGRGWLARIRMSRPSETEGLLAALEYALLVGERPA